MLSQATFSSSGLGMQDAGLLLRHVFAIYLRPIAVAILLSIIGFSTESYE